MLNDPPAPNAPLMLQGAYRPFFLLAALFAFVAMMVWAVYLIDWAPVPLPAGWHAHEMVFGFAALGMSGFLLTAVPNWTRRPHAMPVRFVVLLSLWATARILTFYEMGAWAGAAYFGFLAVFIGWDLYRARNSKNAVIPVLIAGLAGLELTYALGGDPQLVVRSAVYVFAGLIALIGGRVVPAFTFNALKLPPDERERSGLGQLLDWVAVPLPLLVGASEWWDTPIVSGVLAAIAAVVLGMRMHGWRGWSSRREPIVWILHMGYVWLPIGLGLIALTTLFDIWDPVTAFHALTVGAIGTMIMAIASRAALGHAGHPIKASKLTVAAYLGVILAAVSRLHADDPKHYFSAAVIFAVAWGLFFLAYWPVLTKPRSDGRPG